VEAFTDAVRLRALSLGARVIDVLDREIQLVLVPFGVAAELAAAVSQQAASATMTMGPKCEINWTPRQNPSCQN
jgi:hypothetical protein